jgi:hypothetical protein
MREDFGRNAGDTLAFKFCTRLFTQVPEYADVRVEQRHPERRHQAPLMPARRRKPIRGTGEGTEIRWRPLVERWPVVS